jgi:hypothetical protein
MKRHLFLRILFNKWFLTVAGVSSVTLGLNGTAAAATNVALAEHLVRVNRKAPKGFTVVVQLPFVVIGDEPAAQVRSRATNTVKWASDRLKQDYFKLDPVEIIDIWLFKDRNSYTNHARRLFQDTPTTPYGYYSAEHRALIMNIATGNGTLVHEIVHPFMRANFPRCPAWFNEGLASLYERPAESHGHIRGKINWRFKGLEQAITERRTIPFQQLMAMSPSEFYGGADSANYNQYYAQARYLCYYLQEKRLLTKFYHEFVANSPRDQTGFTTLKHVLGENDMAGFQKRWEEFVLALRHSEDW